MMMRTVVIVGTLLLGVGAVVAQQDVVKVAQTQMKGNGKNAGALAAMVKGEKPYDQATVDAALAQFADTAKKLPTLFPDSIKGMKAEGDYQHLVKSLGRQGRLQRAYREFRARPSARPRHDQRSRHAEGRASRDRQAMRRLSRDFPRQEELISLSAGSARLRSPDAAQQAVFGVMGCWSGV